MPMFPSKSDGTAAGWEPQAEAWRPAWTTDRSGGLETGLDN